jgi:hypothetical protein
MKSTGLHGQTKDRWVLSQGTGLLTWFMAQQEHRACCVFAAAAKGLPPPAPKKIPVRLWVSHRMSFEEGADYPVRCGEQPPSGPGSWTEIHSSSNGFHVLADS